MNSERSTADTKKVLSSHFVVPSHVSHSRQYFSKSVFALKNHSIERLPFSLVLSVFVKHAQQFYLLICVD